MTNNTTGAEPVALKGIGKINGDGWKDTTRIGQIVYVWNEELPPPYTPGQYPRIGQEHWSASRKQYDFEPATAVEVRALYAHPPADQLEKLRSALEDSLEREALANLDASTDWIDGFERAWRIARAALKGDE